MPIPKPTPDEDKEDFINRCMSNPTMVDEYERDQRFAICNQSWRNRNKSRSNDMNKTIYKYLHIDKGEFDEKDFTVTATATKEIVDRDGDVVKVSGIDTKNWKKNPVIMLFHNYHDFPVGVGIGKKAWVDGDELKVKFQFLINESDKAYQAARLWKAGALRGLSVGFIPDHNAIEYPEKNEKVKTPSRIFNKVELLEISVVPIPANQAALMAGVSKSVREGKLEEEDAEVLKSLLETQPKEKIEEKEILEEKSNENTELTQKLVEKDQKILELEQKIKEYEIAEELKSLDIEETYLTKMYAEYQANSSNGEAHVKQTDIDAYVGEVLKSFDKNREDK
jgi:uncharacterized protein